MILKLASDPVAYCGISNMLLIGDISNIIPLRLYPIRQVPQDQYIAGHQEIKFRWQLKADQPRPRN